MTWWGWLLVGIGAGASWPVWFVAACRIVDWRYERLERQARPVSRGRILLDKWGWVVMLLAFLLLITGQVLAVVQGGWGHG